MSIRNTFARYASQVGLTRSLEFLSTFYRAGGLLVLNYHRIGSPDDTPYDPGVFSATEEDFDWQVVYLKKHYRIATLEDALDFLEAPQLCKSFMIMITFDDGYIDNYQVAFPILRQHGLPATFFLTTSYVETQPIPWWDSIAWCIKKASEQREFIELRYPNNEVFPITKEELPATLHRLLGLVKTPTVSTPRFIEELEAACQVRIPTSAHERLFFNWEEAREMVKAGMSIGSHTNKHEILSKLTPEQQLSELVTSREIIEKNIGTNTFSIAYPVGAMSAFNINTFAAVRSAGYQAAFSFYGGVNSSKERVDKYDIKREAIELDISRQLFRLRCSLASMTGKILI